ncbi:MAG: ABC transporter substrate-binding protein [Candidatus Syntropharchaeia archaeon]
MRSKLPICIVLFLVSVIFLGCITPSEEKTTISIGYQPSTHQIAEMTAMEKGWWERDLARFGVTKITEHEFPSGPPEMQAMLAGDIDIAYVGATPPITAIDKGLNAKIVAGVQINGSHLVVRPDLAENFTMEKLKGKKIATFPPGSIQDTLLRKWLIDNGMDPDKDVEIVGMGPGDAVTAMKAGAVDAAFLPHPAPAIIELEGAGKMVVPSGEMWPNHACCCLVVSDELIEKHPEIVKQIIKTHINATIYNREYPDEAAEIYAERCNWNVTQVRYSFENWDGVWVYDPYIGLNCTLEYAKTLYDLGFTNKLLTREDLFNTALYDEAIKEMGMG